jgi:hypothetical protein
MNKQKSVKAICLGNIRIDIGKKLKEFKWSFFHTKRKFSGPHGIKVPHVETN